jgi:DNA-binding CsgD family transcriptional regulator/tetratricopeptide (TPR) repeat protein
VVRCPVLVERDDELRTLSRLASEGAARLAVITGEAGAGKSRLAREFASSLPDEWSAPMVTITRTPAALPQVPHPRPLALILEDAHFLDPGALAALPARLDGLDRVLLVLTFRLGLHAAGSAEMRALARLVRDPRALELRLMPLSPAGIVEMAAAMGRYATEDLYRRTGGNPFWAEQLLGTGDTMPWTVVETVTSQLDALPGAARDLACALAVAEEALPASAAVRLSGGADAAWAALADAGLVEHYPAAAIALRHTLVGEAIRSRLGPAEHLRQHARVAEALEGEHVARDRVARHWAAAGDAERAAPIARAAAAELRAQGAIRRAFDCYEIAVRHPPAEPEAAAELYEDAAVTAARIEELAAMHAWITAAERLYRAAGRPDRAARMRLDPAFDYLPVGRSGAIREEPVERMLVDAQAALREDDAEAARRLIAAAVDAARVRRDGMALARAARMTLLALGEFEYGEALLDEALTFPDVAGKPGRESRVEVIRALVRFAQGYALEALDTVRRAVAISRREADAVRLTGQIALGDMLVLTGEVEAGAPELIAGLGEAAADSPMARCVEGYRCFEAGDPAGLDVLARAGDELLTAFDYDPLGRGTMASHTFTLRALAEVHGARPEAALRTVRLIDTLSPQPFSDAAADLAYVLARAGAATQDREALAVAQRRIGDLARVATGPGVLATAEAVRGFATPPGESGAHFQAAAALFERAPRAILAAELWCDAGDAAALERAQRLCDAYGLRRLARRVAGVREALPARATVALAPLSLREREVVTLAAEGLSNREIGARLYLSEGTVRNYLSTAYAKLGVSRRAELGRLVAPS